MEDLSVLGSSPAELCTQRDPGTRPAAMDNCTAALAVESTGEVHPVHPIPSFPHSLFCSALIRIQSASIHACMFCNLMKCCFGCWLEESIYTAV